MTSVSPVDDTPTQALQRTRSAPHIAYIDQPAGEGAEGSDPVLLLHGVGSSSRTWGELLPLMGSRRFIAMDYRGHGASDAPTPPYVMDDFVDDAIRLLDELGVSRVHVIGFSIGALFAERLAIREPARVRSLLLLNSIANRSPEALERARARAAFIASTPPAEVAPKSAPRWFTPEFLTARPDLVAGEIAIVEKIAHAPYAAAYHVLVENDLIDEVKAIRCPTLIITGENDEGSTPAMSEALHQRIAGSRLTIVPGVKHYIHIERPEAIAAEWTRFVDEVEATPAA